MVKKKNPAQSQTSPSTVTKRSSPKPTQPKSIPNDTPKQANQPSNVPKKQRNFFLRLISWIISFVSLIVKTLLFIVVFVFFVVYMFYGGGIRFPNTNLVSDPIFDPSSMEKLVELQYPPGNIAVSSDARVFFTLHPMANPPISLCELISTSNGPSCIPFPSKEEQAQFNSVLSVRIAPDSKGNELLWVLDDGYFAWKPARLLAYSLDKRNLVHEFEFSKEVAGLGSMLNDFQIDPKKQVIYIADASILRKKGAILVYDIKSKTVRRVLDGHPSVQAKNYKTLVNSTNFEREMVLFGVFTMKPNVDSIALDREGKYLYYASINDPILYRANTLDLLDPNISPEVLSSRIESFVNKTQSDGMTTDREGNIYYGDMENSAIMRINTKFPREPRLETLIKEDIVRWPDGFSFGPEGYLYFTCSSLQHVLGKLPSNIVEHAPYHIFRFKPGFVAPAGQ